VSQPPLDQPSRGPAADGGAELDPVEQADGALSEPAADNSATTSRWQRGRRSVALSVGLFIITFMSVTRAGALTVDPEHAPLLKGLTFAIPLMAILLAHELGHYVAARIHGVPASPPFFIPFPWPPLGTMGAVILMRGRIARRDALLDIGAAGPLAGMVVALPVLAYGIATSPVLPLVPGMSYEMEGRSLLYSALLWLLKGPIPQGHDIMLSPTAFAGWAGLMVTMINLIPAGQLDGGHVAYALFGERQERHSRALRRALPLIAAGVSLAYGLPALFAGARGDALGYAFAPGLPWLVWSFVLRVIVGRGKREHPQTDAGALSPRRRVVAAGTLLLFVLLFMPAWMRVVIAAGPVH
jgi:membrane-associated protease RseP (regulator of RpoE activity)